MIPMNKVEIAAYRYAGCAGSCFTLFQSCLWLIFALVGAICKFLACGSTAHKRTFKYCFYLMYYYEPQNATANFTRMNYISPIVFHGIMWTNVLLCIANIAISVLMARAFIQWKDAKLIRKLAYIWTRCILAFSLVEFIFFIVFASDIVSIKQKDDVKCFLKETNLSLLKTSYMNVRTPAPYLLQLKSNLKAIKKKLKKYKRNLLFMDAVFDEKNPEYVKNPFVSKTLVNSFVEDIWRSMFNNNISEKVRRKTDTMPTDKVLRKFIISEHLDLDEVDYDLLKNFDGLTNNKWLKPIHSSNVVFGKQFNLSSSITATNESDAELDKIKSLLTDYFEAGEFVPSANHSHVDQNLDEVFNQIIEELEKQDTDFVNNEREIQSVLDKIDDLIYGNDTLSNEDILLSARKLFQALAMEESIKEFDDKTVENLTNKIKEFLDNNKTVESDHKIFENRKFDHSESKRKAMKGEIRRIIKTRRRPPSSSYSDSDDIPTTKKKVTPKKPTTPKPKAYKNFLIGELCENCPYFILGPSIVCMVLALKTGLVWVLNIIVAILVLYYGTRIKLKTKYKFFPCLSKNE